MAGLSAPSFGPVSAVTTTGSVIPVLSSRHISTSGSPSGTVMLGISTLTSGTVTNEIKFGNHSFTSKPWQHDVIAGQDTDVT